MPTPEAAPGAGWRARLELRFAASGAVTRLVHNRHEGPLRLIRALPQPGGRCDAVIVHPPGGLVGGDRLEQRIALGSGTHVLCTTPGAQKWYRARAAAASASTRVDLGEGAALEWLPHPAIAYDASVVDQSVEFDLAPGAALIGWECLVLGRGAMGERFRHGRVRQRTSIAFGGAARWAERADAGAGERLFDSPLGWGGRSVACTVWAVVAPRAGPARALELASPAADATPPDEALRDAWRDAIDAARDRADGRAARLDGGASIAAPGLLAARLLADDAQAAMSAAHTLWSLARRALLGAISPPPRIWAT